MPTPAGGTASLSAAVQQLGRLLQGTGIDPGRLEALARELLALNDAVRAAAGRLESEDEPSRLAAVLAARSAD